MSVRERVLREALGRLAEARAAADRLAAVSDDWAAGVSLALVFEDAELAVREFARHHLGVALRPPRA